MPNKPQPTAIGRRQFVQTLAMSGVALAAPLRSASAATPQAKNPICAFTKALQSMTFDELAQAIAQLGYDGVELAVRPNGHITPEKAGDQLPRLSDALAQHGLKLTIMASDITSLQQPHAMSVLRAASRAGVRTYRLGYYYYDLSQPIPQQLDSIKSSLRDVVAASNDLGLVPVYQNHSGTNMVGAPLWDLHEVMQDYTPDQVGIALDLAHMTVEGGVSWPVQYHLMRPHLRAVYVKDFVWKGQHVQWVPLGEGRVDPKLFDWLRESGFDGPISLHVEYLEEQDGAQATARFLKEFKHDLKTLRRLMDA